MIKIQRKFELALVTLASLIIGTIAYAQVIDEGVDWWAYCVWGRTCPTATTICIGGPLPVDCYICDPGGTNGDCFFVLTSDCHWATWQGGSNDCGVRKLGKCLGSGGTCAGPFVTSGWCPRDTCWTVE